MADAKKESRRKIQLDVAIKSLAFARDGASKWQLRITGLHMFAITGIGVVKAQDSANVLIPWISLAVMSLASIMAFFATGFLMMTHYWERQLDLLGARPLFRECDAQKFWQWPNAFLLASPMLIMGAAVAVPGFLFIHESPDTALTVVLWFGLVASTSCFIVNALILPMRASRLSELKWKEDLERRRLAKASAKVVDPRAA